MRRQDSATVLSEMKNAANFDFDDVRRTREPAMATEWFRRVEQPLMYSDTIAAMLTGAFENPIDPMPPALQARLETVSHDPEYKFD